jgi:hypothetical protein
MFFLHFEVELFGTSVGGFKTGCSSQLSEKSNFIRTSGVRE